MDDVEEDGDSVLDMWVDWSASVKPHSRGVLPIACQELVNEEVMWCQPISHPSLASDCGRNENEDEDEDAKEEVAPTGSSTNQPPPSDWGHRTLPVLYLSDILYLI